MTESRARDLFNENYLLKCYEDNWDTFEYLLNPNRQNPCTENDLHAALIQDISLDWLLEKYDPIRFQISINEIINNSKENEQ